MKKVLITVCLMLSAFALSAQELNVASFNLRNNSNADYAKQNGWTERRDVLCQMINLEAFDVLATQEVKKPQLDDVLERCPDYEYIGEGRDGGDKGEHCAIFYRKERIEKLEGGTFWLSPTPDCLSKGWDVKYPRICTWGLFRDKMSKVKFYFFNIHLDHRGSQARVESVKLIIDYVTRNCKGANVIVTGDFNVTQMSDPYKELAHHKMFSDCYDVAKYRFAPTGTFNGFNAKCFTTHRIDHMFVSKGIKVGRYGLLAYHYLLPKEGDDKTFVKRENRDVKCLSDHYAVQAWVLLEGAKRNR